MAVGNEVFVDTGLWIAAARRPDAQHERGKALGQEILGRRVKVVISDMVLAEVVTFVLKKDGPEAARRLMDLLEENTTILYIDKPVLEDAKALLRQYWAPRKRISVCDATSVILMQRRGINDLYSFDSGFDGLPGIHRIG
ncbi:MAG TPA: PIN domain-containing protein [Thermoplasmata archaeon]|nr:PIN domain-containing protein [Thermoplasmata archaeon]